MSLYLKEIITICFLSASFGANINSIEASQVDVGIESPIDIKDGKCTIVYGATYLKSNSFAYQKGLLNYVYLPSTLKRIEASTFAGSNLKRFDIPLGIKQIPARCFAECKNLTHVNCMQSDMFSLERIGMAAFMNDTQLVRVVLPETVKVIEERCFSGCTNLRTLLIPSTIRTIAADAFKNVKLKACLIFSPKGDRRSQSQKIMAMMDHLKAAGADISECRFAFATYQTDDYFINPDCSTAQKQLIDESFAKLIEAYAIEAADQALQQKLSQSHRGNTLTISTNLLDSLEQDVIDTVNRDLHGMFDLIQWGNCAYIEDLHLDKTMKIRIANSFKELGKALAKDNLIKRLHDEFDDKYYKNREYIDSLATYGPRKTFVPFTGTSHRLGSSMEYSSESRPLNSNTSRFTDNSFSATSNVSQNVSAKTTVHSNASSGTKTDERADLLKKVARLRRFLSESLPNENQIYFNQAADFLNNDSLLSGPIDGIKGAIQYVQDTLKNTPLINSERGKVKVAEFNALIEALFDNFNNQHFAMPNLSNTSNVSQNVSAKTTVHSNASSGAKTDERADLLKKVARLRRFLSESLPNEDQRYFNEAADFLSNDSLLSGPIDGIKGAIQYVQETLKNTPLINSERGKVKVAEFNALIEALFDNFNNQHFAMPNLSNTSNVSQNVSAKTTVHSNVSNGTKTDERADFLQKVDRLRHFLRESIPNEDQKYFNEAADFLNNDSLLSGSIDGIKGAIQYVQETLKNTPLISSDQGKAKIANFSKLIENLFNN